MVKALRLLSSMILIGLQWLLVLWGLFLMLVAPNTYVIESSYFSSLPPAAPGQDSYSPPTFLRMVSGLATGLIATGVGAGLFYLRRIFLGRQM